MNILYKVFNCSLLLFMLFSQEMQAVVGDSHVANWKDNKSAAFLIMFDDGMNSAYQVVIPELLKRNLIATLYVNPGGNKWANPAVEGPNQWENLIPKTGMVYGNHTWTHNGAADLATEDSEIRLCQEKILSIFYADNKPHLISYGQPGVTTWFSYGAELTAILAKYNLISRPTFDGHGAVYHWQTIDQMLALADKAITSKGREYLIIHGVERRASEGDPNWGFQDFWPLNKDTLRGVLNGLATRRDNGKLWITDHISQYKYQMERDNKPTFQVLQADNQMIQLKMTGTLDSDLYDLPLTVITQVPTSWHNANILQGTQISTVPVVNGVIQYDALPNGTLITLSKNTDTQAPTVPTGLSSSSITQSDFTLSWVASTDSVGVIGYDVYQGGLLKGSTSSTNLKVAGLIPDSTYVMTVRAKDAVGNFSAFSESVVVQTLPVSDNLVVNGGFENTSIAPWIISGGGGNISTSTTSYEGLHCVWLGGSDITYFKQTIIGLKPNTSYLLTAQYKNTTAATNIIGVKNYTTLSTGNVSVTLPINTNWTSTGNIIFVTGASMTTAMIYFVVPKGQWPYVDAFSVVEIDTQAPKVEISSSTTLTTNSNPIPVTFIFNEKVTDFTIGDLSVSNGIASNFVALSGTVYTSDITPSSVGTITVDIAAGTSLDAAGNTNDAAIQFTRSYTDAPAGFDKSSLKSSVYSYNSEIIIEGFAGQIVAIYSISGQLVKSVLLTTDHESIIANKGFYFVKIGTRNFKLLQK